VLKWIVAQPGPVQRQRNSKLDEHFAGSGNDRAGDIIREGGQNAGDAKDTRVHGPVRVRITLGTLSQTKAARYLRGLTEHLPEVAKQKGMQGATAALSDDCTFLTFEDFNTTGLTGDPATLRRYKEDPPNAFHTFFRAEGQTDKDDDSKQGSKGVGKVVFMSASIIRAVLGLTCRVDDGRTLLFGTAVLHTHRLHDRDYDGDAWFGDHAGGVSAPSVAPVDHPDFVNDFRNDFCLTRQDGEPGFSIVVPWLNADAEDGVTADGLIDAILRDHIWSILNNSLVFEIVDFDGTVTTIDSMHFLTVLESRPHADDRLKAVRAIAELAQWALANQPTAVTSRLNQHADGVPYWTDSLLEPARINHIRERLDAGEPIALRVPLRLKLKERAAPTIDSFFDIFLQKDSMTSAMPVPSVAFIRGGIHVSGMSRRVAPYHAIVVAEDRGIAGFLRAAENPSHTKWNAKPLKDKYTYAPGTLRFVVESVKGLTQLLERHSAEKEVLWADSISLPSTTTPEPHQQSTGKGKRKRKVRLTTEPRPPRIVRKRPFDIHVGKNGFGVMPSGIPFRTLPASLVLQLAYHVRGKNPLSNWEEDDFDLTDVSQFPTETIGCALMSRTPNTLTVQITDPHFRFSMSDGFDTRRELFCKPLLKYPQPLPGDDEEESGAGQQTAVATDKKTS